MGCFLKLTNNFYVDFAPLRSEKITGIARVGLSILIHLNEVQEFYLVNDLDTYSNDVVCPDFLEVSYVPKGLLAASQTFEQIQLVLNSLNIEKKSKLEFEDSRVLYPFWRPQFRISRKEFSILYDFSTIKFAESHSNMTIERFNRNLELLAKFNTNCICISESTRRDALAFADLASSLMIVIPCGVNPFFKIPSNRDLKSLNTFSKFVFISSLEPRKRVLELLEWWHMTKYRREDATLTIIGDVAWWSDDEFLARLKRLKSQSQEFTFFLGYASEEELIDVLSNCDVLIYPSKYEGFGLPVLDALFFQKKVLLSANSSMLEFNSNFIEYIDGDDLSSWDSSLDALAAKDLSNHKFQIERYNWQNYVSYLLGHEE